MYLISRVPTRQVAEDQSGLQSQYFRPTSTSSVLQDSGIISAKTPEESTFNVEDIFRSRAEAPPGVGHEKQGDESRLDASGFNAEDFPENPFEVCAAVALPTFFFFFFFLRSSIERVCDGF